MNKTYGDVRPIVMQEPVALRPVARVQAFRCRRCRNIGTVPKGGARPVCWGCGAYDGDAAGAVLQTIGKTA